MSNQLLRPTLKNYLPAVIIAAVGVSLTLIVAHSDLENGRERAVGEIQRRVSAHYRALQHGIKARIRDFEFAGLLLSTAGNRAPTLFSRVAKEIGSGTDDGPWVLYWDRPTAGIDQVEAQAATCVPLLNCQKLQENKISGLDGRHGASPRGREDATVIASTLILDNDSTIPAVLITSALERPLDADGSSDQNKPAVTGHLAGVFLLTALVESVLREFTVPSGLNMYFVEPGTVGSGAPRYVHWSRTAARRNVSANTRISNISKLNKRTVTLANQAWTVYFQPTSELVKQLSVDRSFTILMLGLLTTGAFVAHAISWIRRQTRTEALVSARTEELGKAMTEAQKANKGKTRFLAAASHDLRQPLQAARHFAGSLSLVAKDEETRSIVKKVIRSLDSTSNLLAALLDISRLDTGVLVPHRDDFCVGDMIKRLVSEHSQLAAEKKIHLSAVPSSVTIRSDPDLLDQILRNLISNAVRYTVEGRVLVGCRRRGQQLSVEVHDTGIGISEEDREQIFQEFHQVHKSMAEGGLGLGLATADRIARLLGHELLLSSKLGAGSSFRLVVPVADRRNS